jgi:hypothetical protein
MRQDGGHRQKLRDVVVDPGGEWWKEKSREVDLEEEECVSGRKERASRADTRNGVGIREAVRVKEVLYFAGEKAVMCGE